VLWTSSRRASAMLGSFPRRAALGSDRTHHQISCYAFHGGFVLSPFSPPYSPLWLCQAKQVASRAREPAGISMIFDRFRRLGRISPGVAAILSCPTGTRDSLIESGPIRPPRQRPCGPPRLSETSSFPFLSPVNPDNRLRLVSRENVPSPLAKKPDCIWYVTRWAVTCVSQTVQTSSRKGER
jgi:hypothetical protein